MSREHAHDPFASRVEVGQIVDIEMQGGGAYARARVIAANDRYFMVEYMTVFAGTRERYPQGMRGVVLVADG